MPKWENGCIYMLRHKDDVELRNVCIGSTTNFRNRKNEHKTICNCENHRNHNQKKYQYIRTNGGWDNWKMIWLEDYPCKSKKELVKREDEVMLEYQNRINQIRAHNTDEDKKQWHINNRPKKKIENKRYYENNKEEINKKKSEIIICNICGSEVRKSDIARHQKSVKCQSHIK